MPLVKVWLLGGEPRGWSYFDAQHDLGGIAKAIAFAMRVLYGVYSTGRYWQQGSIERAPPLLIRALPATVVIPKRRQPRW